MAEMEYGQQALAAMEAAKGARAAEVRMNEERGLYQEQAKAAKDAAKDAEKAAKAEAKAASKAEKEADDAFLEELEASEPAEGMDELHGDEPA